MSKKQERGSRHNEGGVSQDEAAAAAKKHRQVKTPDNRGEHPPGMGEDEDETYVPEKERP